MKYTLGWRQKLVCNILFFSQKNVALFIANFLYSITMQEGTVKFFNETKGFGFITPSNGGPDIFVHVSGLISKIREKDRVSFEVQNGKKGLNAVNVQLV